MRPTAFCFLLFDSTYENEKRNNRVGTHFALNKILDSFVEENDNTFLIYVRKYVLSSTDLTDNIRHYKRNVYYKLAIEIVKLIESFNTSSKKIQALS
ncbi:hypothetical protein [Anaerovibrio sp. RM50]|uniref:hypothetical protein n=1 Tax=Anaerovibrio sp. RM50 TaxID=1200557 RepID=UPI0012EC835D|nr:hypothetical protein [Anaerovibrio sp. RM50]